MILVVFTVLFVIQAVRCFAPMAEPEQAETPREVSGIEVVPLVMKTEIVTEPEVAEAKPCGEGGYDCIDKDDWERLACVIYQEAGSDSCCDECRRRVADVVLNRVNDSRYPNTIKEVLEEPRQWGMFSETGIIWPERASLPEEQEAVARAYDAARDVLEGRHSDLTNRYIFCAEFPQGEDWIYCDGIYFGRN